LTSVSRVCRWILLKGIAGGLLGIGNPALMSIS
jgi:hypothetical protein